MAEEGNLVQVVVAAEEIRAYKGDNLLYSVSWVQIYNILELGLVHSQIIAILDVYRYLANAGHSNVPISDPNDWLDSNVLEILKLMYLID